MVHANGTSMHLTGARSGSQPEPARTRVAPPAHRRRVRIGAIGAEIRRFARQQPTQITVRSNSVLLIVALEGWGQVVSDAFEATVDRANALLLARPGGSTLVWTPASEGVVLHLPRQRMQVLASRRLDIPVRLGPGDTMFRLAADDRLFALLGELADECDKASGLSEDRQRLWSGRLEAVITTLLVEAPDRDAILPVSRSVRRVMQHVRDNAERDLDQTELAAVSGVTLRTLREGFRSCLGVSLATFVQDTRLAKARERLQSGHDSRTMTQVAEAAGFGSASSFSRAYARAFEESPSQTRARGVRQTEIKARID